MSRLISSKIACGEDQRRLCSRLFLCFQIQYTVPCATSFLRKEGAVGEVPIFQTVRSHQAEKMSWGRFSLSKIMVQISELYWQERKMWSLFSFIDENRIHMGLIWTPQEASLARVGRRFSCATHMVKTCLGVHPLNQTELVHDLISEDCLIAFNVLEDEKPWHNKSSTNQP